MANIELSKEEISMVIGMMNSSSVQIKDAEKVLNIYNKFKAAQKVE